MLTQCLPLDAPQNQFTYCPSLGAAILFSILFGVTMIYHVYQATVYHASFCWVLIMSAIWQTAAFIIRCISIEDPTNEVVNDVTYCLVLLAPLWTNAFCFMVMARLTHMFMPDHKIIWFKGSRLGVYFVILDISSFVVQLIGALDAISKDIKVNERGLHIYTAGVALQEFFILCFVALCVQFLQRLKRESSMDNTAGARKLTYLLFMVLALISVRIIYRIIEFSGGFGNSITREIVNHEAWQYWFDTTPMFIAIVLFHLLHPGRVLTGPESRFPTRKEKKAMKMEKKRLREQGSTGSDMVDVPMEKAVTGAEGSSMFERW